MPDEDQMDARQPDFPQFDGQAEGALPQRLEFEQLEQLMQEAGERNVNRFDDVPLTVSIELGRVTEAIRNILDWREGAVVETKKLSGQPMEIMVNGRLFGHGEVVVVGDNLAIRITELIKPPTD